MELKIKDLCVSVENKEILKGVNIVIKSGEVQAIMGPNGSGKSTLAQAILGHPKYKITKGDILLDGESILPMSPDERAAKGLFLAFQYPFEIQGVAISQFLWRSILSLRDKKKNDFPGSFPEFRKELNRVISILELDKKFMDREVNVGFSGGEKKRVEIVQMLILKPRLSILDETDSGLDIDSIKVVSKAVESLRGENFSALLITHYQRILNYVRPDIVHIMSGGKIAETGGFDLVDKVEKEGYAKYNTNDQEG